MKPLSKPQLGNDVSRHVRPPLEYVRYPSILRCGLAHTSNRQLRLVLQHLLPLLYPALGERLGEQLAPRRVSFWVGLRKDAGFGGGFAGDAGVPGGLVEARAYLVDGLDGCRVVDGDLGRGDADDGPWSEMSAGRHRRGWGLTIALVKGIDVVEPLTLERLHLQRPHRQTIQKRSGDLG